ncbi:MAG: hypothetical protein M1816_004653 [Peltula sp. TS41687]|nr:MAG: hypothetical protein M1816_004653 [Peltula sp. TS41687]
MRLSLLSVAAVLLAVAVALNPSLESQPMPLMPSSANPAKTPTASCRKVHEYLNRDAQVEAKHPDPIRLVPIVGPAVGAVPVAKDAAGRYRSWASDLTKILQEDLERKGGEYTGLCNGFEPSENG